MKRFLSVLIVITILISFCSCSAGTGQEGSSVDKKSNAVDLSEEFDSFVYTHYASGGTTEDETAVILFENANSTFTSYQVAFISCTCRDSSVNYYSVMYIELLNNKKSADEAAIRAISFGDNKGLWGDSNPTYGQSGYTPEYFDEHFLQPLVGYSKADFDKFKGYGTQLDGVDVDAVTGASVSSANITSCIKSLFEYHAEKYYSDKTENA